MKILLDTATFKLSYRFVIAILLIFTITFFTGVQFDKLNKFSLNAFFNNNFATTSRLSASSGQSEQEATLHDTQSTITLTTVEKVGPTKRLDGRVTPSTPGSTSSSLAAAKAAKDLVMEILSNSTDNSLDSNKIDPSINDNNVYILDWTGFFGGSIASFQRLDGCPDLPCQLTENKSLIDQSAAVLFHVRDLNWNSIPTIRHPWQYYTFFLYESPLHTHMQFQSPEQKAFFNLTMTYRLDSDVPSQYSYLIERVKPNFTIENQIKKIIQNKTKLIAWFASNCNTPGHRERYVEMLKRYIPVDVYGSCGTMQCASRALECDQLLIRDYKFYLSFENSLCLDYVTEKFYERIKNFVVPIVLERANYKEPVAPKNSFIAADDFQSPEKLAEYLYYLDEHPEEYARYFHWHSTHEFSTCKRTGCDICQLCREVIRYQIDNTTKIIPDVSDWWYDKASCHQLPARMLHDPNTCLILDWTNSPVKNRYNFKRLDQCPQMSCEVTTDRNMINISKAVVFDAEKLDWNDLPKWRLADQYYVILALAPPAAIKMQTEGLETRKRFFNLTMTYSTDSDIYVPYGFFRHRTEPAVGRRRVKELIKNKRKLIAWYKDDCKNATSNMRLEHVQQLQQYVSGVDIVDGCQSNQISKFTASLKSDYKFYLSFETGVCREYVTGEFFDRVQQFVVPVVMKRLHYPKALFPPDSFIAVDDFASMKQLADYLTYLDKNVTAYAQFFGWHEKYTVTQCPEQKSGCGFCDLCRTLRDLRSRGKQKIVEDIEKWWTGDECTRT